MTDTITKPALELVLETFNHSAFTDAGRSTYDQRREGECARLELDIRTHSKQTVDWNANTTKYEP